MGENAKVLFDELGEVALVTLNRPAQRNAIDAETCVLLRDAIEEFERNDRFRIAVLRGSGAVFCAGMDLKAFSTGEAEDILFGPGRLGGFVGRSRRKPVIAAVQGAALAGGFELMLACDMAIATRTAKFGLPESKRGLVAGAGGAFRIGQRVPRAIANEILLTGDWFSGERAYGLGLVNRLVDEAPDTAAIELAQAIARNAPLSLEASLELSRCASTVHEDACWEANDRLLRALVASKDAHEGARAFAEKRDPVWVGK
jgi:enoyl-CoA hydratase/carnithine racemase